MFELAEVEAWQAKHRPTGEREQILADTVSAREVCSMLSIGRSTLRERTSRLRDDPSSDVCPPYVRVWGEHGPEIRFYPAEVTAWLRRQADRTRTEEIEGDVEG